MRPVAARVATAAALLALLAAGLAAHAVLPAGPPRIAAVYAVAAAQVALVLLVFMRLAAGPAILRIAAAATAVWLAILFGFTALDYLHR